MSPFKKAVVLFLMTLPHWSNGQAASSPVSVKLLPQAQVDSAGIFLDQVAVVSGTNQVLPHLRLAPAPYLGQTASLSRNDLLNLIQTAHVTMPATNWSGALHVQVSRRTRIFEDSDLLERLTESLQRQYVKNQGELEVHLTQAWVKPEVPDENITLEITQMPTAGVTANFVVSFELWNGKERVGHWQAPVQASVWRDIPIAHSTLQRGDLVLGADITMERGDILAQRDLFLSFPTTDDSLEFTESIPAGRPIPNRAVRVRPVIMRGQLVEAVFQEGTLAISLMVETLEDGALGQVVRVRNPKTRRELSGKVENDKTVRISL